jgi:N6-adenosine-specific RNA methylase IME4
VTYAAALLGFEFGSQRGFSFDLKVGLTWLKVDSKGTGTFTGSGGTIGAGTTNEATIKVTNPTLRATAPTVQLGFQYFF